MHTYRMWGALCEWWQYGKMKDRNAPPCFTLFTNKKSFKYNSGFHFRVMCFIFLLLFFFSFYSHLPRCFIMSFLLLNLRYLLSLPPPLSLSAYSSSIFNSFVHFYFHLFRLYQTHIQLCFSSLFCAFNTL